MVIKSCRNSDIIPILEKSIFDNDGLNCQTVSEWANYIGCETDIRFVSFAIARAGREINKIAHQNTGEYDRIGNNFTHWKDNPHYKVFPKNYQPNMTTTNEPNVVQDYENLNSLFGVDYFTAHKINENLLFNNELLNRCRKECKPIDKLVVKYDGKMITNELTLVNILTVHPAGKEIKNNDTGKVLPKGFQIRYDTNINEKQKNKILNDIWSKYWNPTKPAMILFHLPIEYQYTDKDGNRVVWGIVDGAHRFGAASDSNQESIIAWLIDMPLNKIPKFANAELNRIECPQLDRSPEDVAASICLSILDEESDIYAKLENAEDGEKDKILRDEIMTYHYSHHKEIDGVLRRIQHNPNVVVDRKQYGSDQMKNYIAEHVINWTKTSEDYHDYVSDKGVRVIVKQAQGESYITVANHICRLQSSNKPITVAFTVDKARKLTKENADAERREFIRKVNETIEENYKAGKLRYEDGTFINPSWVCFPELADEFDDGLINIL